MKKKLLTIILGLASTVAFGQIDAGTKILTGTFSFYSDNDKVEPKGGTAVETPSSSFTIAPMMLRQSALRSSRFILLTCPGKV